MINPLRGGVCNAAAEDIVNAVAEELSALYAEIAQLKARMPTTRSRSKKQKIEEELRESDLTAQLSGRDNIVYGHHDMVPRGEHVARRSKN